jgi:hypothetical protein
MVEELLAFLEGARITSHCIGKNMADATIHLIALSTWWNTALSLPEPARSAKSVSLS